MSAQQNTTTQEGAAVRPFHQLHTLVPQDGSIVMGNCAHCVSRQQRPAIARRSEFHPEGAVDYTEDQLKDVERRFAEALARHGVQVTSTQFIPKETMSRATD